MPKLHDISLSSAALPSNDQLKILSKQLSKYVLSRDLYNLSKALNGVLNDTSNKKKNIKWIKWYQRFEKSLNLVNHRNKHRPKVSYPDLPIGKSLEKIKQSLTDHQFLIIEGETGSGKTTQIPKICVEMGFGSYGMIGVTQPRRIAAKSISQRLADELASEIGDFVGWQVRFGKKVSSNTVVKVMTDGLLLSEINNDKFLTKYKVIILDEAHERSLNIDFLLGYLWKIRDRRPDLKVIVTSATIDTQKFSKFLAGSPIIKVPGRSFPVEIKYLDVNQLDVDQERLIINRILEISDSSYDGDVLVFLSSEREIRETEYLLKKAKLFSWDILPLFSRLSTNEQNRIFIDSKKRRIILSTNIAETSITVPNVRFVIDTGKVRISRYSFRSKIQRLPIESISRASADQRAGRSGRTMPGICYRLYTQNDYDGRSAYTDPEILRTSLASVILRMLDLRIGNIDTFSFVDQPDSRQISDGYQLLQELRALSSAKRLTEIGRFIVKFQIEPRLAKMLLEAANLDVLNEVIIIVAGLSIQDPVNVPKDKVGSADFINNLRDESSDFISLLNISDALLKQRKILSKSKFNKFCKDNFISTIRFIEWMDLVSQLKETLIHLGYKITENPSKRDSIHRAILSGLVTQVGMLGELANYNGTRNREFSIFPGSHVSKKRPKWVMAGSLFETTRQYALNVAKIDNRWIEKYASHLVKKQYSEPFYHQKSGSVLVKEQQLLFGLPVVINKLVAYENTNPALCREIFITEALVNNLYKGPGDFFENNTKLFKDLEEKEDRFRTRDILLDDKATFLFYDNLLPSSVINLQSFERWRIKSEASDPKILFLTSDIISNELPHPDYEAQFPKQIEFEEASYALTYKFEPGHPNDGISVTVPLPILHQVPKHFFEWLIPGLLREKCIEMVKVLPKSVRKNFVPIPTYIDAIKHDLKPFNKPLGEILGIKLFHKTGIKIDPILWDETKLDPWYRVNFQLIDENGEIIESSKSLTNLKAKYRQAFSANLDDQEEKSIERSSITVWDFGDLQKEVSFSKGNLVLKAWPGLVDQGPAVSIKLFDDPMKAEMASADGQLRLACLQSRSAIKKISEKLFVGDDLAIKAAGLPIKSELIEILISASFQSTIFKDSGIMRSQDQFQSLLNNELPKVKQKILDLELWLKSLLSPVYECQNALRSLDNSHSQTKNDIVSQLENLFSKHTLTHANDDDLNQYPKYLKAILIRIDKTQYKFKDNLLFSTQISELLDLVSDLDQNVNSELFEEMRSFKWAIEELRVSLFAQQLKTREPVSYKRLSKRWEKLQEKLNVMSFQ